MFEVVIVLLLVIFAVTACLTWVCIKLIGDRLDSTSLSKLSQGYLKEMGDAYAMGFNQRAVADAVPPTGPHPTGGWDAVEQTKPHLHEPDTELPDS